MKRNRWSRKKKGKEIYNKNKIFKKKKEREIVAPISVIIYTPKKFRNS